MFKQMSQIWMNCSSCKAFWSDKCFEFSSKKFRVLPFSTNKPKRKAVFFNAKRNISNFIETDKRKKGWILLIFKKIITNLSKFLMFFKFLTEKFQILVFLNDLIEILTYFFQSVFLNLSVFIGLLTDF
jgi:hypothetical protein